MKKIYIIGIGGIGISGIARYYNENGYEVFGSDKTNSELIKKLKSEGIDIIIGEDENRIDNNYEKIIYTEAVPKIQSELKKAIILNLKLLTYPESLAEIANQKKLIAVAGTHGKSTTTSLISIMMKNSSIGINSLVGSLLKEFDGKNTYFSESKYFCLEACEYKRSFLRYDPYIGVITNIEIDHLDYYKNLDDYISAFKEFQNNIVKGGYLIIDKNCKNSIKLYNLREDINYILIDNNRFIINGKEIVFEKINLKIPGNHILFDAKIAYIVGYILGLEKNSIIKSLESYNGIWRRSEIVG
ncbi:MAG: Mur ligase family protein, partial [Candidatus Gracilibacteria bacterium]|nr:Mur ligase family protein [Candidatus Gracilibacteria bacterium]